MTRLDQALVEHGLCESRERAKRSILAGQVRINGQTAHKASDSVRPGDQLAIDTPEKFVSRGGHKLEHAMLHFNIVIKDLVAIDLGASTGGFTDCLLQHGAARVIAGQMGIGDQMFQMLRNANKEFDQLDRRLILTEKEFRGMKEVNRAWQDFTFALAALRDRIVSQFHEPMLVAVKLLRVFVDVLVQFTDWLSSGTTAANVMKYALLGLAGLFFLVTFAASELIVAIGLLKTGILGLMLAASPLLVPFTLFLLTLGLITVAIVGLLLLLDDFWAALDGKKHVGNWDNEIMAVQLMVAGIEHLISLWKVLTGQWKDAVWWQNKADEDAAKAVGGGKVQPSLMETSSIKDLIATAGHRPGFLEELTNFALKSVGGQSSSSVHQENNVKVMINGATDPQATGAAAGSAINRELVKAAYQIPMPAN